MLKELDLHVTNRCTTSCKYCCFSSNRKKLPELTTDELKNAMATALSMGCEHVHFTGGEPLLRDDILTLISYARELGLQVRLQTNGMLLSPDMAKNLIKAGLTSIMISLDSYRPEIHDAVRGKGTWNLAIQAIQAATSAGLTVRVNSVITKVNYADIYSTIRFLYDRGIRNYSAFYFSPIGVGRANVENWLPPSEYKEFWNKLNEQIKTNKKLLPDMNIVIEKGYADWDEAKKIDVSNFSGCGGGCMNTYEKREYLILRCDGNVYPCIMAIDSTPLGNIRETSLEEIHKNSIEWRKMLLQNDKECSTCEHFKVCGEGCRYYPDIGNSNPSKHDFRCTKGKIVPLCPIMKYNMLNEKLGGSSDEVME